MEETALFDNTFIEQKLEDERAKEEDLAEVTTNIIKKFASAKDRHGVIKSFQKRYTIRKIVIGETFVKETIAWHIQLKLSI